MRAISNRIRRLERTLLPPPVQDERESLADVLDRRRRRHLEAAGLPVEDEPRETWTPYGRNVSRLSFLRQRHHALARVLQGLRQPEQHKSGAFDGAVACFVMFRRFNHRSRITPRALPCQK
jgi:hypothetical protein